MSPKRVLFAALALCLMACGSSGAKASPDGGGSSSGTGGSADSISGAFAFTPGSAVAIWATAPDGGLDPTSASVYLSTQSHDRLCATLDYFIATGGGLNVAGLDLLTLLVVNDGASLATGTYPVVSPSAAFAGDGGVAELTREVVYANGPPSVLAVGDGGTLTLTTVTLGHLSSDGGSGGGELKGTFLSSVDIDGGTSTLSGTFDATGCNH